MFLTLLLGFFGLIFLWDYLNKKHRNELIAKSKIAGDPALPIIGNAHQVRGLTSEKMIDYLSEKTRANNKIFRNWFIHQLVIYTADPKDFTEILSSTTQITKNNVYDMLSQWLGDGLLMSTGKKWHKRRKIITPTFHFKILEQFVEIFDQQSTFMIKKLADRADGKQVVNIFPVVCLMALDVIAETAMGVKVNAQMNPDFGYTRSVKIVTDLIAERLRHPAWRIEWLYPIIARNHYKYLMEHINEMKTFTRNVIQKRRIALQQELDGKTANANGSKIGNGHIDEHEELGFKKRQALLDVLLQANVNGKPLGDEDIREEVETFMFEGHDTTTSAISFALYEISRHPEVQCKLYTEIIEILGTDKTRPASLTELQSFKYMECVIKETLRLYPSVPAIGRYIKEDYVLNNKIIPANTHIILPLFVVMRDPDCFYNPDKFIPERFLGDEVKQIDPYAFVPFSAGPRNCIGQKFAMLEMKSAISKMLRHYELLPLGENVKLTLSLILRSTTGINLGLKPRVNT